MEMTVKRLLSYACCLAVAIILHSSLLILNSISSLAASVVGGEVGPFVSWPDAVAADEAHTPGSAEFYKPVDEMAVYDSGVVCRNGAVVTNVPFPQVVASMDDGCDFGWCYDFSLSVGEGETFDEPADRRRKAIRMNQFDVSWTSHSNGLAVAYYAYGTGCVKKAISPSVMLPVSRRMDSDTRSALLATYEAYFERLYWGSASGSNDWDTTVWGRTTPGPGFRFNVYNPHYGIVCTNHFEYVYPTNDVRLLEHTNFVALAKAVKRMFPTFAGRYYGTSNRDHPAWVYRPHWLVDNTYCLWWSSTEPPRMEKQWIDPDKGTFYLPGREDFTLLPKTDGWVSNDEIHDDDDQFRWACRGFTLDVFREGSGFAAQADDMSFPCSQLLHLLESAIDPYPPAPVALPRWKTADTMPAYLTNVFAHASTMSLNPTNAFAKYLRAFANDSHRLQPSAYEGMNHLLAAMNRTINIPVAFPEFSRDRRTVFHEGSYVDGVRPTGEWHDEDGLYHVNYGDGYHTFGFHSETDRVDVAEAAVDQNVYCQLDVENLDNRVSKVWVQELTIDQAMFIDENINAHIQDLSVVWAFTKGLGDGVAVEYSAIRSDGTPSPLRGYAYPGVSDMKFDNPEQPYSIPPLTASAKRGYDYVSATNVTCGGLEYTIQPPAEARTLGLVAESAYALGRLRQMGESSRQWKFGAETAYSSVPDLVGKLRRHGEEAKGDLDELAFDFYDGVDYRDPQDFAPLPDKLEVRISGGTFALRPDDYAVASLFTYPEQTTIEKMRYTGYFPITNETWDVTNVVTAATNRVVLAETVATIVVFVAPDGWSWVDSASTNVVSVVPGGESATVDTNVVAALAEAVPDIAIAYRWPEEPGYPEITNTVVTNYFTASVARNVQTVEHWGTETTVTSWYDMHLQVTNVTTNVTALAYAEATTNETSEAKLDRSATYEWGEHREPTMETQSPYAFMVDKLLVLGGGTPVPSWVYVDPVSGQVVPLDSEPYPIQIGTATLKLVPDDEEELESAFEIKAEWPEMPMAEFHGKEAVMPITRVDWNWKSMKLKGE